MTGNGNSMSSTPANGTSSLEIGQSNQDLLVSKGKSKKRKWIITIIVLMVAIGLAVAAIVLLSTGDDTSNSEKQTSSTAALTLDEFLHGKFVPKSFNGTWTSGHEFIYTDSSGNLIQHNLRTNVSKTLIDVSDNLLVAAFDFQLSADGLYLLVAHSYQKLYRHSFLAQYIIFNLETGEKIELLSDNRPAQLVVWAPVGNGLAYVFENNIYYKKSVTSTEVFTITSTTGAVSNGVPDWVNEEEVFSSNKALWFSPNGKKLSFARFIDTNVSLMIIPVYGEPGKLTSQYPRANVIKYPKAGTTNPTVTLYYVDLTDPKNEIPLNIPTNINNEQILTAVEWATNDDLTAIWMNRVQNNAILVNYNTTTNPPTTVIIKNLISASGWLELFTPPKFSKNGSQLILILSQDQGSNAGSYRHIVMFNRQDDAQEQALTRGKFVVSEILGWNYEDNLIYYSANTEEDSAVQHIYSVSPDTKDTKCLSCHLKSKYNSSTECLYNTADFSKDSSFFVLTCAGPDVPQVSIYNKDVKELQVWNSNEELANYVQDKLVPSFKKMSFDIGGGFKANVMLRLPPNIDMSGETKYPMLVNVYGGPDTYQVIDKFFLDWGSYLASNKSIIYAVIDGRGSGLRGDKLMFAGYRKLGTVEVEDQLNVTRMIQKAVPYVDATRTAIWGWSYGGYVSGMALATDKEGIFKCGISVAPVTDWALYDSIYTERFMGLPTATDNLKAYEDSQLLKRYEGIRDKEYFLIHGTHDDNVHYQQSMLWSRVLELNDILFRQQSYPDEDHNLSSVRPHLYHSLENFLDDCFIEKEV